MKRWPLLLTLMCLPGVAVLGTWAAGRWEVASWDAHLPLLEVPAAEGEGGFADLRYAWADRTPEARAGRLAGTVRRDARAGYASDEDWGGEDAGEPWDEAREQAREACFALEDEIAAADCLVAIDEATDGAAAVPPAATAKAPADDGRPVGTVFGPKPDGRQPGAGLPEGLAAPAPGPDPAEKAALAADAAASVDLRPAPDDDPAPAEACAVAGPGTLLPDCLALLDPDAARAWLDGHAHALAATRRGLAAAHRRDPRPHGGRPPAWPELGRLARTAAALRFLDGDQAGGLAEACTLSLQWRRQLMDPGVDGGHFEGLREAAEAARLALDMRLAAPALPPPAHCGEAFALGVDAGPGPACLVMRGLTEARLRERAFTDDERRDPDRRRFAARLVRPYCDEGSRFDAEVLAGAPPEALEPERGIGLLAVVGAPSLAFEAGDLAVDRHVLRALLDAQAQRRALHAAWGLLDAAAAAGAPPAAAATDPAATLAALDPGAGGAQALAFAKSGLWIEVPLWGPIPEGDLPRDAYRAPVTPRAADAPPPPAPPAASGG